MSVLDAGDLVGIFGGGGEGNSSQFRLGTIVAGVGGVWVLFDGEDVAGGKTYKYLKAYTPAVGDRVLLAVVNGSHVILGNI